MKLCLIISVFLFYCITSLKAEEVIQETITKEHYFSVVLLSGNDKYGNNIYTINQINIFSKKTKTILQSINVLNVVNAFITRGNPVNTAKLLTIEDINFDGNPDIRLATKNSNLIEGYFIWLLDESSQKYIRSPAFEKISGMLAVNSATSELHNYVMVNGQSSINCIYKVENNLPVLQRATEVILPPYNPKSNQCCPLYNYYERGRSGLQKIKAYKKMSEPLSYPNDLNVIRKFNNADSLLKNFGLSTTIFYQPAVDEFGVEEGFTYKIYPDGLTVLSDELIVTVNKQNKISQIRLQQPSNFWKIPFNLNIGMSLSELVKLNGKSISFTGFEWDHDGIVSWNGGKLEGKITVKLSFNGSIPKEFIGDKAKISSDNPKVKSLKFYVAEIFL